MRKLLIVAALFLTACLPACSTAPGQGGVTITAPRDFGDTLMYGYRTNALVRRSAAAGLNAKLISKSDAQHVLATTNTTRAALDEAMKLGCPDLAAAIAKGEDLKDVQKPACIEGLPDTTIGKAKFAAGLADNAYAFLKTLGAVK